MWVMGDVCVCVMWGCDVYGECVMCVYVMWGVCDCDSSQKQLERDLAVIAAESGREGGDEGAMVGTQTQLHYHHNIPASPLLPLPPSSHPPPSPYRI